ncbi:MAG TPA: DUF6390 family protein [Candidatus Limnocylindrales bacterium]|nr:DUF6390 family protein [Candidatus Limnocylindrales bacterium]
MRVQAPDPTASGVHLFARYAYGPNRLGLCGPDEPATLLEAGTAHDHGDERLLRELAKGFDGAYPYLDLIARANGIGDPLDRRVVEAYWLGSPLSGGVTARELGRSVDDRFRRRMPRDRWRWLAETPAAGARPIHAFHVLDVFPKAGLLRGGPATGVLETIDSCRIRWGTVEALDGDWLEVAAPSMTLVDGKLALGHPAPTRVRAAVDGVGFLEAPALGDVVSIHWSWACDRLTPAGLAALEQSTRHELAIANRSI